MVDTLVHRLPRRYHPLMLCLMTKVPVVCCLRSRGPILGLGVRCPVSDQDHEAEGTPREVDVEGSLTK